MIHAAVVGAGYIGNVHLETLNRISGVKTCSVFDLDKNLSGKAAEAHNISVAASSFDEILQDPEIDVVHICTPNNLHFEQSLAALEAGKQVFSEKPLALTSKESEILVNKAKEKGAITGVGFCYRYYPVVQEMAMRIRGGQYGRVRMVSGTWFQDWLSEITDYTWRLERERSGVSNVAADLGSHWFDLIQFVTGLTVSDVFADLFTILPEREKPAKEVLAFQSHAETESELVKIEVEDYASVLFRLDKGKIPGSFTTSQVCHGRKSDTEFQVYCSDGSLAWNHKRSEELWIGRRHGSNGILVENPLEFGQQAAQYATLPAGHPMGYRDAVLSMLKDYYRAVTEGVEGDGVLRPNFQTGYHEMLLLDRVLQSAADGRWVQV